MSRKGIEDSNKFQAIKLSLCLAVMLLIAKPFVGFEFFSGNHTPATQTILVKSFTKRKQEYIKGSKQCIQTVKDLLNKPVLNQITLFSFFLSFIAPVLLRTGKNITGHLIALIRFALNPEEYTYLRTGKLSI